MRLPSGLSICRTAARLPRVVRSFVSLPSVTSGFLFGVNRRRRRAAKTRAYWLSGDARVICAVLKLMSTQLPKAYEPQSVEQTAYQTWIDAKAFSADPNAAGEPYAIVIPPPNVTGALHLGHAINNTLQDILIRKARMEGKNAVWIPGIDHAGIATQAVVEKQLKEKENKTRHDVGREALVKRIWEWKQQYGDRILSQLKRMGCSCDWDRTRFTLDEMCARAVRETFFKLFRDGLVFRGKRLVNWDVHLQTSVSDDEIYHETVKTFMWHIKYPIVDAEGKAESGNQKAENRPDHLVVATTRPETMLGDTAVAVHSTDPRWQWAIGKFIKLPLTDRLIPIIADDILVDPKFGTGCVKVTPAHDPNDYAVWQRHQGQSDEIGIINILNPEGTFNENAGAYAGLRRDIGRKKVVEDLTHLGLLVKEEPYETQVGHSDRSKTAIEPYLSDQWFVKMAPLAEPALEVVRQGMVKFHPERHAQQYLSWLGEKRDWPISRQLWWGHRIPVWSKRLDIDEDGFSKAFDQGGLFIAGVDHILDVQQPDSAIVIDAGGTLVGTGNWRERLSGYKGEIAIYICTTNPLTVANIEEAEFVQDPDVLDTWFSSALWPHSTLGWPEKTPDLAKWNPTSVLITARDIITLWVARMVMMNLYNMGENRWTSHSEAEAKAKISAAKSEIVKHIPFFDVAINPTILDGKGERMSKSKGNGVDPVDIIDTHGADALRFTLTSMATETQDVRLPVKKDAQGRNSSEKFDVGRNFCNKLWNASRFAMANLEAVGQNAESGKQKAEMGLADRWILSRLARTVAEANEALAQYRFDVYARTCYDFFWRDFCDWYVEVVKPVFKDPASAGPTAAVLAAVLDQSLRLMHPMIPFITETIWWKINEVWPDRSIAGLVNAPPAPLLIRAAWPTVGATWVDESAEKDFTLVQETITAIRNVRNEHKVDLKRVVKVSISAVNAPVAEVLNANRQMLEMLASCSLVQAKVGVDEISDAVRTSAAGNDIYLEGMVDAQAEGHRLAKRKEELTKLVATLNGRLQNAGYMAKAPPHLVEQTRKQLADAEAELARM